MSMESKIMSTLEGLNDEQREAVTQTEGFVRVIAGAGSGKTRALTHRFAYLVNDIGILPQNILCVTFTNKAASEMRRRIRALTGDNDTGYIATFHGFCVSVLQEDSSAVSYPKSFLVIDNSDINAMLSMIYEERSITLREKTFSDARDMIEMRKLYSESQYYEYLISMSIEELRAKYQNAKEVNDIIFYGYLLEEKKCFALDYNDLLIFTLYIFSQNSAIREKWQRRLEYIMIDEFQDIDSIQHKLMRVLCDYHKNLFVVGDGDQTIYSWRGADGKFLSEFDKHFPDVKTIMMRCNYRSTPAIINAANSLIGKNRFRIKKDLFPMRSELDAIKPLFYHASSSEDEALFIAKEIKTLIESGRKAKDIAVLFRAHYISRAIENALKSENIEYTLSSGVPFFEREEIKDSLCYLRFIAYKDDLSFLRISNKPKRNIGTRRLEALKAYAEEKQCSLYSALKALVDEPLFKTTKASEFIEMTERFSAIYEKESISELLSKVLEKSGYEKMLRTEGSQERLDNLAELKQSIYEYETTCGEELTLENYLSRIALYTSDEGEPSKNAVRLSTVHGAKGLEFPVVFIAGLSESMFPAKKTSSVEAMEEERRLFFVALTRAKDLLYLSDAEGFTKEAQYRHISRFVFDIDKSLLRYSKDLTDEQIKESLSYIEYENSRLEKMSALSKVVVGSHVKHAILGKGVVESIDEERKRYVIRFEKLSTTRELSFKAPLELL